VQTWESCRFFDHYKKKNSFSGTLKPASETRRCDIHHTGNLQDSVQLHMKPSDAVTPVDQIFTPDDCSLGPFDADVLLASIGPGNTLWYVGDSVTAQMFFSTGCLLEAAGFSPRWAEVEWKRLGRVPKEARPQRSGFTNMIDSDPNKGGVGALHRKCVLVAAGGGNVRMCSVFTSPHELLQKFPRLLQRIAGHPSDTVVMNFGVRLDRDLFPSRVRVRVRVNNNTDAGRVGLLLSCGITPTTSGW
jgi:hypothetical protein